jgi:hypothetical protein
MEYENATSNNVPVWILVDAQVYAEYQTFQRNRNSDTIVYAHVDSVNIFYLLEEILLQRRNNALYTFSRYTDIEDWLREQWAGIFRDLLKRTAQSQQLASLSAQVFQLSELNKTLKTYLENLMRTTSPQEHERVIRDETLRLQRLEKLSKLSSNPIFFTMAVIFRGSGEKLAQIIEESETYADFLRRVRETSEEAGNTIEHIIGADKENFDHLNICREIVQRPKFDFETDGTSRPKPSKRPIRRRKSNGPSASNVAH